MSQRTQIELSTIVQPGDTLVFTGGSREVAAGQPYNQAKYRRGHSWIVAVKTSWGCCPAHLGIVTRVERDGRVVWSIEWERVPIQRSLI